jgi:hypothetical protein
MSIRPIGTRARLSVDRDWTSHNRAARVPFAGATAADHPIRPDPPGPRGLDGYVLRFLPTGIVADVCDFDQFFPFNN